VAFIFVLLLAPASMVSANTVCKCNNGAVGSPSKQVVGYNVQISESGEQYNETIEVDTEKQTELFKVPAHRNVDHSNILHDFKMNMTMLQLPEKKICYLLPLNDELLTPRKLIDGLDNAERVSSKTSKTTIIDEWTPSKELTDRSVLSDELAAFCAKYPIYFVKKMEESLESIRIQTGERKTRKRRQVIYSPSYPVLESNILCSGGKGAISAKDYGDCIIKLKTWQVKCKITTTSCYWIRVCPSFDKCYKEHLINRTYCCEYICAAAKKKAIVSE